MLGIIFQSRPRKQDVNASDIARLRLPNGLGGSRHERRVAAIAVKLFDLLQEQHGLTAEYRNLLRIAALLHDAGRVYGAQGHDVRGARMVLEDRSIRLSPRERRGAAYLVRFHRGPVPACLQDQDILLAGDKHRKLRILLGILRASDALDSRRLVPTAIIMKLGPRKLRINCLVESSLKEAKRRLGGRRKFALLESEMGFAVKLQFKDLLPTA